MEVIKVKLTLYVKEKCQKLITISLPGKTPLKLKNTPQNQIISISYLLQAQLELVTLLLACYCGSSTMCRRSGNCVDSNRTDF